jgi:hypothetical protein
MISKPTIVITSLGRTGTLFFANLFRDLFINITSLHEPDLLTTGEFYTLKAGIEDLLRQIREAGFGNKIIKKAFGGWSLADISDDRVRNEIVFQAAVEKILKQRSVFIENKPGAVYAESSAAFYGLIDICPGVFSNHRIVYIIRDGRDWIRSKLNYNSRDLYSKGRIREYFSHHWPNAITAQDEKYSEKWTNMDKVEKLCWAWSYLNNYAINSISKNPNSKLFYFEDLFNSPDRYEHLKEMLDFLGGVSDDLSYDHQKLSGVLDLQVHASKKDANNVWSNWSALQKDQFIEICGPTMERVGYKI